MFVLLVVLLYMFKVRLDHIVKIYLQHAAFYRIKSMPLTVNFAISFEKHFNRFRVCFQHVKERVIRKLHKRSMRGIAGSDLW